MVDIEKVEDPADQEELHAMVERHYKYTGSSVAEWVLENWEDALKEFVKVMPVEYRNALLKLEEEAGGVPVSEYMPA